MIERATKTEITLDVASDRVIASMPIPPGGAFMGFKARIHGIAAAHQLVLSANMLALKGVIVNLSGQMDQGVSLDTIFDQFVPKDVVLDQTATNDDIDWDDGTISAPFADPGLPNWSEMVQLGDRPHVITDQRKMNSFASPGAKFPHVDTTDEYYPTFTWNAASTQRVRVKGPSYFLLAIGNPAAANVDTSPPTTIANGQWSMLTYPDIAFDIMLPGLLGITETGAAAETNTAARDIADFVEPVIHEQDSAAYINVAYRVFCDYKVRIAAPGRPQNPTLKGNG